MTAGLARARRGSVGVLLAATCLLAGCGVGAEDRVHRIAPDEVPFGLLDPPASTEARSAGRSAGLYLVLDDRLALVERRVDPDAGLTDLLEALSAGPTEVEQSSGLESLLPPGQVVDVVTERGVARVDLQPTFGDLRAQVQTLAIAQIVFTLTGQSGIGRVGFTIEGEPVEVPRADGALTTEPVARDDFSELAPAGS